MGDEGGRGAAEAVVGYDAFDEKRVDNRLIVDCVHDRGFVAPVV